MCSETCAFKMHSSNHQFVRCPVGEVAQFASCKICPMLDLDSYLLNLWECGNATVACKSVHVVIPLFYNKFRRFSYLKGPGVAFLF